jgi:hypothetical protein
MSGIDGLWDTSYEDHLEDMDGVQTCIVLFYKDDCEPCHELGKILHSVNVDIPVMVSNLEVDPELALCYNVVHPSTLVLFKQGTMGQMNRKKKAFAKGWTEEQIMEWADV